MFCEAFFKKKLDSPYKGADGFEAQSLFFEVFKDKNPVCATQVLFFFLNRRKFSICNLIFIWKGYHSECMLI